MMTNTILNPDPQKTKNISKHNDVDTDVDDSYRLSVITTRQGDHGQSSLSDGVLRPKFSHEFELMGTIDEVNSHLALIHAQLSIELANLEKNKKQKKQISQEDGQDQEDQEDHLELFYHQSLIDFKMLQNHLFDLGAAISAPLYVQVSEKALKNLDILNQELIKKLPPLKEFILPGGSILAAHAHIARTVARRAERLFWQLYQIYENLLNSSNSDINLGIDLANFIQMGKYLNRLSDYLFNYARYSHQMKNIDDICWENENKK